MKRIIRANNQVGRRKFSIKILSAEEVEAFDDDSFDFAEAESEIDPAWLQAWDSKFEKYANVPHSPEEFNRIMKEMHEFGKTYKEGGDE